uniref:CBFD_NFYB_HMF domain-containing protein n=1 Tax=Syphacia muris TaxID=451379 RepID=A0A0N5AXC1_9BILA
MNSADVVNNGKDADETVVSGGVCTNIVTSLFPVQEVASGSSSFEDDGFDVNKRLANFWADKKAEVENLSRENLRQATRNQDLPLARIKKIMKLDDALKEQMISAEVPIFLAKACEILIEEITLRSWRSTELGKRKTLQKCDISHALADVDKMDFLVDFVPRPESRRNVNFQPSSLSLPVINPVHVQPAEIIDGRVYVQQEPGIFQVLQIADGESPLQSGAVLQATPIGQPIQLQQSENGDPSIITVNLPDGAVQQFHLQVPQQH